MEKSTNKLRSNSSICDIKTHISSDQVTHKVKKNKSKGKINKKQKSLKDFFSIKKLILKSAFDHKGSKHFLAEKSKAMEELILEDEIITENKDQKEKRTKKSISPREKTKEKNKSDLNHSIYGKIHSKLNIFKNIKKHNEKIKMSNKTVSDYFKNNIKDIGKIIQKNNKKNAELIIYISSNKNLNDPSFLITSENDSLIKNIINEMTYLKN